ncbi:MAG: hypothetical protein ACYSXD_01230 [Planctomycetota bacterium]
MCFANMNEPVCMIDVVGGNKIYYYHYDGPGSVVALSDVNSKVNEIEFMEFKEYEIRDNAVNDYIRESIDDGLSLMKKVGACRNYATAKKCTYYKKEGFVLDEVRAFYGGCGWRGVMVTPTFEDISPISEPTTEWITEKIFDFVNLKRNHIAVFEDFLTGSESDCLKEPRPYCYFTSTEKYYNENEVYYFVDKSCLSKQLIKDTLGESENAGPFYHAVLTSLPDEVKITNGSQVSMETIELMATRAEHLVFGAFDSEGYILCSF